MPERFFYKFDFDKEFKNRKNLNKGPKGRGPTTSSFMAYFFVLIDLPFVFIRSEAKEKRSHTKKGSFMQCITGGPPMDSSNSMNEGRSMRKAGFLYEDSNKKKKGSNHILLKNLTE